MQLIRSPISLPEQSSGRFQIKHMSVTCDDLVTMREAWTTGKPYKKVTLAKPRTVHQLVEEGSVWMTDRFMELRQMHEVLKKTRPFGTVLVGGLGLGIQAMLLARRHKVRFIDVVELEPDVIRLCDPGHPKIRVVQGDIMKYIECLNNWPYDFAYFDTWAGTNEGTWWSTVMPLRRLIANKFGYRKVWCWAEDIMWGQILRTMQVSPPHWRYEKLPLPMSRMKALAFLQDVGLPGWERKWGNCV